MQKAKGIIRHVPNFITSLNLLSGCISITLAFEGKLDWAAYMIGIAAVFDFLDGMAARLLKAYSEIGKQLDSLADMVSFGVAPSAILYALIKIALIKNSLLSGMFSTDPIQEALAFIPFLIAVFSALRLAKFNIDERQTSSFIGLPTPANAILIASLPLIIANQDPFLENIILNKYLLIGLILVLSYLLISEIPMFSLKFKHLKWKENEFRFIFLALSFVLIVLLKFTAIPIVIFTYILLSVVQWCIFTPKK